MKRAGWCGGDDFSLYSAGTYLETELDISYSE
jgi:hypothetical protein